MNQERETRQKKIVKKYLCSVQCHPSADKIYKNVKKKLPKISKATVYRILRNLSEKGEIQEIPTTKARWDYNAKPHPHFFCTKCNKMIDLDEPINIPQKRNLKAGKVENYRIVFCGTCNKCLKNKKVEY